MRAHTEFASEALHIVIFENFVESMMSYLSKLKVTPSFCIAFKIPDNVTATNAYELTHWSKQSMVMAWEPLFTCSKYSSRNNVKVGDIEINSCA